VDAAGLVKFPQGLSSLNVPVVRIGLVATIPAQGGDNIVALDYVHFNHGFTLDSGGVRTPKKGIYQVAISGFFDGTSDASLIGVKVAGGTTIWFGGCPMTGFNGRYQGLYFISVDANTLIQFCSQRGGTACNLINGENTGMTVTLIRELP
jgi:hypothetical protein